MNIVHDLLFKRYKERCLQTVNLLPETCVMFEGHKQRVQNGFSGRKEMLFFIISVILFTFYEKKPGTLV